MRLSKLRIRNFRNITDSTLDIKDAKFVLVRGANRNGKTSIAEAISLALTKTTWGLDDRGAGFVKKIKRGEQKSILEADLQGTNHLIRRTTSLSVTSTGRTQATECIDDPSWMPAKFDKLLSDKSAALGIALNTRAFMSMVYSNDEKAQKSLLASLVLPARYDFPKDTITDVETVLGEGVITFEGEPFTVIDGAYKKLFAERQDVNRKVKEFVIPDALPVPQGVNSASLQSDLTNLRAERLSHSGKRDAAVKLANEGEVKRTRTKARIESLEASIRADRESLNSVNQNILSGTDLKGAQDTSGKKEEWRKLLAEQATVFAQLEAKRKERASFSQVPDEEAKCPTCGQEIDNDKFTSLATNVVEECNRLTEEAVKITQALGLVGNVDNAITKLEKHQVAVQEKTGIDAKFAEHTKSLADAKAEAERDTSPAFDFIPYDKTLTDIDAKIESSQNQLRPVIAAEERAKEIVTKTEQLKRLEDKASKLDKLTRYFDKGGIKAKLIATHIGAFEHKVNEVLREWDYSCALSIEPWKFEVTDHRKVATPIIELSGAEELMFYAAFQCAVSRTAGIGFVVIDRIDTLLPDLRPILFRKLYGMVDEGTLDQVILLVADTSEQVPKLENSVFFIVEDGNVRRLG